MLFGALGDLHGDFAAVRRIMERHPDVPFWLCVGDVADADGRYDVRAPLYWIKGNNENFDGSRPAICPADLHYIPNGTAVYDRGCTRRRPRRHVRAEMYHTPAAELPHRRRARAKATEPADQRRHFVREEVEACKQLKASTCCSRRGATAVSRWRTRIDAGEDPDQRGARRDEAAAPSVRSSSSVSPKLEGAGA